MFKTLLVGAAVATALFAGSQADAQADYLFTVCPSGQSGVATTVTSCAFADATRASYFSFPSHSIDAYSPVTGKVYDMYCDNNSAHFSDGSTRLTVRCDGGANATVVFW
jgi:hypothetical protein